MLSYNRDGYYYDFTKLSNNQTAGIAFVRTERSRDNEWWVLFAISNKKKKIMDYFYGINGNGEMDLYATGNCGYEGLIWAFHKIEEMIEELSDRGTTTKNKIVVQGSDKRRFRIYEHFLARLGFRKQLDQDDGMTLIRIV